MVTDQTSAHDPLGGYVPGGIDLAAALAFHLFDAAGPAVPFVQAFAAGGLLTMLVDTMIPEAFEDAATRPAL